MKKTLILLMILMMGLVLCACGGGDTTETTTAAPAESTTAPAVTEAQVQVVDITPENWAEYFEIASYYIPQKNAFGEVDNFYVESRFCLKEGLSAQAVDVAVEFACVQQGFAYQVDFANGTLTFGEAVTAWGAENVTEDVAVNTLPFALPGVGGRDEETMVIRTNHEVTRIQGTLTLKVGEIAEPVEMVEGEKRIELPVAEDPDLAYMAYVGRWECADGYYVVLNEDGTLIYNGETYIPKFLPYIKPLAAEVEEGTYTYANGTQTGKGCVFVWGIYEGTMMGDHDGRIYKLQTE